MQLVAYGAQDVYLTGNPQITFFKVVYRRHTNFSMESIRQTFNGTVASGAKVTATISRNGDLIHRMYVQADIANDGNTAAAKKGKEEDTYYYIGEIKRKNKFVNVNKNENPFKQLLTLDLK